MGSATFLPTFKFNVPPVFKCSVDLKCGLLLLIVTFSVFLLWNTTISLQSLKVHTLAVILLNEKQNFSGLVSRTSAFKKWAPSQIKISGKKKTEIFLLISVCHIQLLHKITMLPENWKKKSIQKIPKYDNERLLLLILRGIEIIRMKLQIVFKFRACLDQII